MAKTPSKTAPKQRPYGGNAPAGALFVYGTLMDDAKQHELIGRVCAAVPATLSDYAWFGGKWPYILPQAGAKVEGWALLDLTQDDLALLDDYEATTPQKVEGKRRTLYKRDQVQANDEGEAHRLLGLSAASGAMGEILAGKRLKAAGERIGVYPGTFDPITGGHVDIIRRGARLVDRLVIGVAKNAGKDPLFDTRARVKMVEHEVEGLRAAGLNLTVVAFDSLLMDFVMAQGARIIIRGLRAVSDFEYEFQMAGMNSYLKEEIETVFLMSGDRYQFVSSRFVKEIARLGGDVGHFVSPYVVKALQQRFAKESGRRKVHPVVRD